MFIATTVFSFCVYYILQVLKKNIFYLFAEVFADFIHSSPKFGEHVYDCYFECFIWYYLSPFSFILFLKPWFVLSFRRYSYHILPNLLCLFLSSSYII